MASSVASNTAEHQQTLCQQQRKELFDGELFADFKITCGKDGSRREFKVHRAILVARSPYFKGMLTNEDFEETRTGVLPTDEFGPEAMYEFLAFVYSGEGPRDDVLTLDQMKELFRASDEYQVEQLKELCEKKLVEMLSVESALELYVFAELYRAETLKAEAIKFVNANKAKMAAESECWKEFLRTHPELMLELYFAI